MIKDSGERREFETGAVRDIADDKGRCDLLPLAEVGMMLHDNILIAINDYVRNGDKMRLVDAIKTFATRYDGGLVTAMLEVSVHYAEGSKKYTERNWEKGIPIHCFIDSGVRHYMKVIRGDHDEPHDRAFVWNLLGAIWTHNNKPEMHDLPWSKESVDEV